MARVLGNRAKKGRAHKYFDLTNCNMCVLLNIEEKKFSNRVSIFE